MEELTCPPVFNELERKAWAFAVHAHGEQRRKYHNEPYVRHLERVAQTVIVYGGSTAMVMAALLHDVLEDTPVTEAELLTFLQQACPDSAIVPGQVLHLVIDLTDRFDKQQAPGYNRKRRKAMEIERLAKITPQAQTIKLADIIDNTRDILAHDPSFARVYVPEVTAVLEVCKAGNFKLFMLACYEVQKAMIELEQYLLDKALHEPSDNEQAD